MPFKITRMFKLKFFKKFTEWEYWPSYMFYIPNLPYAFYLALKSRNFTFYSAVNPSIKSSGNGTESKFDTLKLVPSSYKPKSIFVSVDRNFEAVIRALHKHGIDYPIIAKPDVGFRGLLVEKIYSDELLKKYLDSYPVPIIIQEFIDLPNECGIFYSRLPNHKKGKITSLTMKSFLSVTGDGVSNLSKLIAYDKRAQHFTAMLRIAHQAKWYSTLKKGETYLLSDIGNHCKGTQFINGNHLIDDKLTEALDTFNKKIKGWYYGRLDVKYNTLEELKEGKNFIVLEINGIISEPTHIYDPYNATYFQALRSIRAHWDIVYNIAKINMEQDNAPKKFKIFWDEIRWLNNYVKKVKKLTKMQS